MLFYDEPLALWISDMPLLISAKVLDIARLLDLGLNWNKEGYVCGVDHDTSMKLSKALDSVTISVAQYMRLALREPRVASSKFAEWLTDPYTMREGRMSDVVGNIVYSDTARPGWFDLTCIGERGLPPSFANESGLHKWKLWTLGHGYMTSGAMRGFVTSSGTCSLDLGIPVFARHPNIMIREAYAGEPIVAYSPLEATWQRYQSLLQCGRRDDKALDTMRKDFTDDDLHAGDTVDSFLEEKHNEMRRDLVG